MLNEIMAEQSQDVNMEQGAIGLGENQVNVESQDGLGLQAVGGVHTIGRKCQYLSFFSFLFDWKLFHICSTHSGKSGR